MTSWDALEAYLSGLVKKVGGVAYALRDSGGRHLAPRVSPPADRKAFVDAARERFLKGDKGDKGGKRDKRVEALKSSWEQLDKRAFEEAVRQVFLKSDFLQTASKNRSPILARYHAAPIDLFKSQSALLDEAVGVDFVRKGPGKRYVHREAPFPFIAERFLSSYLLIIAFSDVGAVDAQGVVLALERARSVISDMLGDLPPDDGGDRAIAQSQRPPDRHPAAPNTTIEKQWNLRSDDSATTVLTI